MLVAPLPLQVALIVIHSFILPPFPNGVKTPLAVVSARTIITNMNLLVVLIVLMLLFGGGGFCLGGPVVGGVGFGGVLLICLVLLVQKRSDEIRHLNRFRFLKNL